MHYRPPTAIPIAKVSQRLLDRLPQPRLSALLLELTPASNLRVVSQRTVANPLTPSYLSQSRFAADVFHRVFVQLVCRHCHTITMQLPRHSVNALAPRDR